MTLGSMNIHKKIRSELYVRTLGSVNIPKSMNPFKSSEIVGISATGAADRVTFRRLCRRRIGIEKERRKNYPCWFRQLNKQQP